MNRIIALILLVSISGTAFSCPTCVGRADKNRPLFFSKQSYKKTDKKNQELSTAQKRYHKLNQEQLKNNKRSSK